MSQTTIDEIAKEVGYIIEEVSYIEWNLLAELDMDTFEDMTLGEIIKEVKKCDIFNGVAVDDLEDILRKRNDLVHKYFKRKDFEKHKNNSPFLNNELNYLRKFRKQIADFNRWLLDS
ncbi:MAG: hypothetical protein FWE03_02390 [Firmicutes bacterium]|nr:hypothetical protein [Bacillota bacterium]